MIAYVDKIREISAKLLKECQVEMVIGFRAGTLPMMNEPCIVKSAEAVDELVWDSHCGINLTNYLTNRKEEKIGIITKGCDARNIVTHIIENKIKREQLVIIGVPCQGMVDKRKILAVTDGEVLRITETGTELTIETASDHTTVQKADYLQANCAVCQHRNPVIHDYLVADLVQEQKDVDRYADVRAVEAMTVEERWDYFEKLLEPCIRCYACRNACPLCYCPTCFVDESKPQWMGKSQDPTDIRTFHFLRAYHCAGRCTDCGACERACPVGINMREFTKKLEKDCLEQFQWTAGLALDARPPLDSFRATDPDDEFK